VGRSRRLFEVPKTNAPVLVRLFSHFCLKKRTNTGAMEFPKIVAIGPQRARGRSSKPSSGLNTVRFAPFALSLSKGIPGIDKLGSNLFLR
jgi:hypothetical protein